MADVEAGSSAEAYPDGLGLGPAHRLKLEEEAQSEEIDLTDARPVPRRKSIMMAMPQLSRDAGNSQYQDPVVAKIAEQLATSKAAKGPSNHQPWYIIDPRTNMRLAMWDGVTSIALVFTAIVTPVEVGFLRIPPLSERWSDSLFITNRAVDLIFTIDLIMQFFLMYNHVEESMDGGQWVANPRKIARHYVTGPWFFLDTFSIGVSSFDLFSPSDSGASRLKVLRAVRVLRLLKLVRLLRGSRIFKRWEVRLSINYAILSIANICVVLLFVCHLFACVWGLQASFDPLNSWLGVPRGTDKEYCLPYDPLVHGGCPADRVCDEDEGWNCASPKMQYLYALYWAIATVTSIGYGDVVAAPLQFEEQLVCVMMMFTGSLLYAYLVGSFCGLAANLAPDVVSFRQDLTDLNRFLVQNQIPPQLRYRLREYMHQVVFLRRAATSNRLLTGLAPKLRNEAALCFNGKWLSKIELLQSTETSPIEEGLILELAYMLQFQIFPPGEIVENGHLYVVSRGAALFAGRVYLSHKSWGEADSLLANPKLRSAASAISISYLFAYSLEGEALRVAMSQFKYPHARERLRRRQVIWILRRGLVRAAEEELSRQLNFRESIAKRGGKLQGAGKEVMELMGVGQEGVRPKSTVALAAEAFMDAGMDAKKREASRPRERAVHEGEGAREGASESKMPVRKVRQRSWALPAPGSVVHAVRRASTGTTRSSTGRSPSGRAKLGAGVNV